jgi:hypothetical protein
MQVFATDSAEMRKGLSDYLAGVSHFEATRALAKLAIFSAEEEVRHAAIAALKSRREKDYTDILVQGLRYPWPAVARRATEALVKLERKDLIPDLVALLDESDPRTPVLEDAKSRKQAVVRELVRINHQRNCLLCHAPANSSDLDFDAQKQLNGNAFNIITGPIPIPGAELPSFFDGYKNASTDLLVRVDVTYLRQDFSVTQLVAHAKPWPAMQRFDFVVRKRVLTEKEAKAYTDALTPREPGVLSPYHRAALAALRDLTGRDTAPTAQAWRKLLGLKEKG